jgi:sialate O-acetylesterase
MISIHIWYKFLIIGFFLSTPTFIQAKVTLPKFFSNNMVLQRDRIIRIWGWADKNESVTINFNRLTGRAKTDKSGKWSMEFPALRAGGPFAMTIKGKDNTINYDNILIGDVWICSGQSNMEVRVADDYTANEEIKSSENKNIRLLKVPTNIQTMEKEDIPPTSWFECNPSTSENFSAVAYFFGKNLQKELNVPIGLIMSAWGGTIIETWTSWEASMNNEEFVRYKGKTVEQAFGHTGEELNNIIRKLMSPNDDGMLNKWYLADAEKTGWKTMYAPKAWDGELKGDAGIVWFKRDITLPSRLEGKSGRLHLGIGMYDRTFLNGEFVSGNCEHDNCDLDIKVKSGLNHIVVRFQNMGGIGGFWRSKSDDFYLEADGEKYSLAGEWEYKPSLLQSETGLKVWGVGIPNNFASLLYNGMIHPLVGFGIKGAIWYQGEGNAGDAFKYRTIFPNLITDWRKQWGYDFPFFWAQLASFQHEVAEPAESAWAELREAQNMTLKLPNTGQAVITDIGDVNDIHPKNKKDVGYRLAQNALKVAYGRNILGSGPVYENMKIDGNKIILNFSNTGTGLSTKEKNKYDYVYGFSIAGEVKKFVWAKAYIKGNNVVVFSDKVANPVAVRYGWEINPTEINIVNSDGLLASPFRTDKWKGITEH